MAHILSPLSAKIGEFFRQAEKLLRNPVVVRDLRAQMRGVKSFGFIAGYLLLLSILAVTGYAMATEQSLSLNYWDRPQRNIVDAQANLETFRWFVFGTLALMVTLIAPALTAASVIGERQRQSFDLLVTTPLTANQLLVGKLLSSVAFLGFLLVLSLPASALCVILGGADTADILRYYFLLAVDGVVLASIGLYFSCTVRVPIAATVWTVIAVLGFLLVTTWGTGFQWMGAEPPSPHFALTWLNPTLAILPVENAPGSLPKFLLAFAVYIATATLIIRTLLSAATYRLGLFGAGSVVSLRRLSLLLAGIVTAIFTNASVMKYVIRTGFSNTPPAENYGATLGYLFAFALLIAAPFLPGLFVPTSAEDAPPGMTTETADEPRRYRLFQIRRLFHPEHSGAFPWYCAFVLVVVTGFTMGILPYPQIWPVVAPLIPAGAVYLLCIGFLMWSLSRHAGRLVPETSAARGLAFAFGAGVLGLPALILAVQPNGEWLENPAITLWLLSPFVYKNAAGMTEALFREGIAGGALGVLLFLLERGLDAHPTRSPLTSEP